MSFINNTDILREIHKSKASYSSYVDLAAFDFDIIVAPLAEDETLPAAGFFDMQKWLRVVNKRAITKNVIDLAQSKRGRRHDELVVRVLTRDHVPKVERDAPKVQGTRKQKDGRIRTIFPAFQHFTLDGAEICRSHWRGGIGNGQFSQTHGKTSDKLAVMFFTIMEGISKKACYRNYTYLTDMQGAALERFALSGLVFNEAHSENPHSYYYAMVKHAFDDVIKHEKRVRFVKDEHLIWMGHAPSHARQTEETINADNTR